MKNKFLLMGLIMVLLLGITACNINSNEQDSQANNSGQQLTEEYELTDEGIIKPEWAKDAIQETASQVIQAISKKDALAIAEYAHSKGVRFTPYTCVSVEQDVVFSREKLKDLFNDQKIYSWGNYDGSGENIALTPSEYFDRFVYSADFVNAEKVGYNEVISMGNMRENQFEVYDKAIVVEYYFSGFDSKYEGADWQSLRLVFQQDQGDWKLVGVIHNQWTV